MISRAPGVVYAQVTASSIRSSAGVCTVVGSMATASSPGVSHVRSTAGGSSLSASEAAKSTVMPARCHALLIVTG